jgi:hypothetical protein
VAVTSVDVNQEAIREIKKLLNITSDREVINEGIMLLLARARQRRALERMLTREFSDDQMSPPVVDYPL